MTQGSVQRQPNDPVSGFIEAVKAAFGTENWDEVEPYLERAWHGCQMPEDPSWAEIRDDVRAAWPYPVIGE